MLAHARRLDAQHPLLLPRKLEVVPVPLPPPPPPCPYPPLPPAIAAKLTSGAELVRSLARQRREEVIPTTFAAVDALLGGGLARGKMTEQAARPRWVGRGASPRVLAGAEMTVRLEKHRRIRPGQSTNIVFRGEELL